MATERQKRAVKNVLESTGSVGEAMRKAGYKEGTAKNPQQLTRSKGWEELMEQYIPDSLLAKKHKELLTIPKKVRTLKKGEMVEEYEEVDSQAIGKGLDMAYKLKAKYAPERRDITSGGEKVIGINYVVPEHGKKADDRADV